MIPMTSMRRRVCWLLIAGLFTIVLCPLSFVLAHDWPSWRGPSQTGVGYETGLPAKFSLDPKAKDNNLIWKAPYGCRATPIVMNGRVYICNPAEAGVMEQERVMCLDADTGKVIWEKRFGVWHTDIVSSRLGWTSLAGDPATGNVYWHGTQGLFICFDKDGKILWQRSLTEEFGRVSGYGGRINGPMVDGDLVIIGMLCHSWGDMAKGGDRYLAMDKKTGDIVWWYESPNMFYATYFSSPAVTVIDGQRVLVTGGGDGGIHAMKARTGEPLWIAPVANGLIYASPVVDGDLVYMCHGALNHGTNISGGIYCFDAAKIEDGKPKLVWKKLNIDCKYVTPAVHDGKLFVCSDTARLYCFDAKKGDSLWKKPLIYGRNAMGGPVWADGKIYVPAVNGTFSIIEPGKDKGKVLYEQEFASPDGTTAVECNGGAAVANGRVYFGTSEGFYCIGLKDSGKESPVPSMPAEAKNNEPAFFRIEPAEVTLYPGESVKFKVQALDANGRPAPIKKFTGDWSLPVPPPPAAPKVKAAPAKLQAALKADGGECELTVDPDVLEQWGQVQFKNGKEILKARVRVVPKLPYKQDFNKIADGYAPPSWANTQGKFFVVTLKNGEKVLRNNNKHPSPVVHNANAYIGKPDLTDYTIEADIMGAQVKGNIADMGIINNRYRLVLKGNQGNLRIESWDAMPRVAVDVNFDIKPDVWYRLKFKVEVDTKKKEANLFGKAWERDKDEPKDWTVTFTDPNPNTEGCPGLFSYAKNAGGISEMNPGTDVYFDNVVITPNKKKS